MNEQDVEVQSVRVIGCASLRSFRQEMENARWDKNKEQPQGFTKEQMLGIREVFDLFCTDSSGLQFETISVDFCLNRIRLVVAEFCNCHVDQQLHVLLFCRTCCCKELGSGLENSWI